MHHSTTRILLVFIITLICCSFALTNIVNAEDLCYLCCYGNFYVPNLPNVKSIRIECYRPDNYLLGDVDLNGIVEIIDLRIISTAYLSTEGSANWDYRCDVYPDRKIDVSDLRCAGNNYLHEGTYYDDVETLTIYWDNGQTVNVPSNGKVNIPSGVSTFQIKKNDTLVHAKVVFSDEVIGVQKQWHDVTSFVFYLQTRKWHDITSLIFNLFTRKWQNISVWNINLTAKQWFTLTALNFQILTKTWFNIDWITFYLVQTVISVAIPILFIGLTFFIAIIIFIFLLQ